LCLDHPGLGNISQLMAVAATASLKQLGFSVQIKWPNDLMIGDKKLAGILTEATRFSSRMSVSVGIGINVNMTSAILKTIDRPVTSLMVEKGSPVAVENVLEQLVKNFASSLTLFLNEGFAPFLDSYRQMLIHKKGDAISFHNHNKLWIGKFQAINSDGTLALELENGEIAKFFSGEIVADQFK